MRNFVGNELKNDLESIYKNTGELLTKLDMMDFSNENQKMRGMVDDVKFKLMDIGGTLQKDLFTLHYYQSRDKLLDEGAAKEQDGGK